MTKLLQFLEKAFIVVSFFFFSQALFLFFFDPSSAQTPDRDSPLLRTIFLLIYLVTLLLLVLRWKKTFLAVKRNKWLFFLLGLAALSTLWSSVPDITFRKSVALIGSTLFGVYIGSNYKFRELLEAISWTFGISIVLSFLFIFLLPQYGVMESGAWRGIYLHKNGLGESMLISFITFCFLSTTSKRSGVLFMLAAIASLVLIIFARSATSLTSAIFVYTASKVLEPLSIKSRSHVFVITVFLLLLFFAIVTFIINFNAFLETSDRDITLTGRTPLWASLWEFIQLKPWFGYGYGAFFTASHPETQTLWQIHIWKPPHSHNGYIQLWLDLGFVGLATFVSNYFYNINRALFYYLVSKDVRLLWISVFLLYTVFFNATEVSFLSYNLLSWVMSVAFICSLNSTTMSKE